MPNHPRDGILEDGADSKESDYSFDPVTLCIAAECDYEGSPAIAMCCDWRAQTGTEGGSLIGAEGIYKIRDIGDMSVLLAGKASDAQELIAACREAVLAFCANKSSPEDSDLTIAAFQKSLRSAAGKRKEEIAQDYIQSSLGISYAEFRQTRRENFTDFHNHVWDSITRLDLGADVIFCGFCSDTPVIIRVDRFGRALWETDYVAIGEGSEIARAMLCLQTWNSYGDNVVAPKEPVSLEHCIYRLFEAKIAAHRAHPSSVGSATAFQVLIHGKGRFGIHEDALTAMYEIYDQKHVVPEKEIKRYFGIRASGTKSKTLKQELLTEPGPFFFAGPR